MVHYVEAVESLTVISTVSSHVTLYGTCRIMENYVEPAESGNIIWNQPSQGTLNRTCRIGYSGEPAQINWNLENHNAEGKY